MDARRWGAAAGLALAMGAAGAATASDETAGKEDARFAPPVRLRAGEKWLGEGRLYPSPVMHDLDGDGVREVIVADLPGRPTFAKVARGADGAVAISAEKPLPGRDGQPLDFSNW
jgi:hypothetical protein